MNSSTDAGAAPIPTNSRAATSGISNSKGTLINSPKVAAMATPIRSFPKYVSTVLRLIH